MVPEIRQKLGSDEEVSASQLLLCSGLSARSFGRQENSLSSILITRHAHQLIMHAPFRALVHPLVDLIDEREWRPRHARERHEVRDGREGSFLSYVSPTLALKRGIQLTPPDCLDPDRICKASSVR